MSHMMKKIKNLFSFLKRAWQTSRRGRFGVIFIVLAFVLMISRWFFGDVTIQQYIANARQLNRTQAQLEIKTKKLESLKLHTDLIKQGSPDFIEEIALKKLNKGDPDIKILKF